MHCSASGETRRSKAHSVILFTLQRGEPTRRLTGSLGRPGFQGDRGAIARSQLSSLAPLLSNYELAGLEAWGAFEKVSGRKHSFDVLARSTESPRGTHASRIERQRW